MDKKTMIIIGVIAIIVIIVAAFALMGGSRDNDPTHLTVVQSLKQVSALLLDGDVDTKIIIL